MGGIRQKFPIELFDGKLRIKIKVDSLDQLIELLERRYSEDKKVAGGTKPKDILWNFGIGIEEKIQPIQIIDERTEQLYKYYWYYMQSPDKINNKPFFETVVTMNKLYQRRGF